MPVVYCLFFILACFGRGECAEKKSKDDPKQLDLEIRKASGEFDREKKANTEMRQSWGLAEFELKNTPKKFLPEGKNTKEAKIEAARKTLASYQEAAKLLKENNDSLKLALGGTAGEAAAERTKQPKALTPEDIVKNMLLIMQNTDADSKEKKCEEYRKKIDGKRFTATVVFKNKFVTRPLDDEHVFSLYFERLGCNLYNQPGFDKAKPSVSITVSCNSCDTLISSLKPGDRLVVNGITEGVRGYAGGKDGARGNIDFNLARCEVKKAE
jgi:hypothetical protein